MLFLILTVSLGMFHATVARTILQNAEENQEYLDGADVMLQEVWKDNRAFLGINRMLRLRTMNRIMANMRDFRVLHPIREF